MNKMLLGASLLAALAANGAQIFSDDFETPGLFVENWNAHGTLKPASGMLQLDSGKSIRFKGSLADKNYAVEIVMIPQPSSESGGHCGLQLDGISFMYRADGRWGTAWRPADMARSKGNVGTVPDGRKGDPVRLRVERRRGKDASQYSFFVNGHPVQAFREVMPDSGVFSLYAYRLPMKVESVTVQSLDADDDSPNAAVNSSFEHLQEGMPLFINAQTPRTHSWKYSFEDFFRTFTTDTAVKHSGERALKLICNEACPVNGFLTHDAGCAKGKPVTGSVWLKAEKPLACDLILWEKHGQWNTRRVQLSTDWKRYEMTVEAPAKSVVCFGMNFRTPGIVWADDVQIEGGTKATEWKASALDREKFSPRKVAAETAKEYLLPPVSNVAAPASLEELIARSPLQISDFIFKGKLVPANRTDAWLLASKDALYIGIRAFVKNVEKVRSEARPHDHGRIFGDDCVEILLDPERSGRNYLHLAVNASGAQADMGYGRNPAWNGRWTASAKINSTAKSIDYLITVPYSDFASDRLADIWGINIGRNCTESNQCPSLLKTPYLNFHLPLIFPTLRWPQGALEPYRVGFAEPTIAPDGKLFSVKIRNMGSSRGNGELTLSKPDGSLAGKTAFQLTPGVTEITMPAGSGDGSAVLTLAADGKTISSALVQPTRNNPLQAFFDRSFYMKEDKAEVFGTARIPGRSENLKGTLKVAGKSFEIPLADEFHAEIPLDDIPEGTHEAELTIPGASCRFPLRKLSWNVQNTPIDTYSRALMVDGKPVFVVAPFFGVPKTREEIVNTVKIYHDAGFRFLMPGAHQAGTALKDFLAECEKYGISNLFWTFGAWKNHQSIDPQAFFGALPEANIRGFLVVDEPELYAKSDEVRTYMEKFRAAMPRVPVFMNNTALGIPSKFAGLATDIIMLDDYLTNSETRTLAEMVESSDRVYQAGAESRKPGFFFHAGGNLHNHYREPSRKEQLALGYSAIVTGLTGVAYFTGVAAYPGNWEGMKQFNAEVKKLEPVIFSREKIPAASCATNNVRYLVRRHQGKVYVIALNIGNTPVTAAFTLEPGVVRDGSGRMLFEDRAVPVKNGKFSDAFAPLERHVYCLDQMGNR